MNNNVNGFQNEYQISKCLNGKKIKDLDFNYMLFLEDLYGNLDENWMVYSEIDYDKKKFDLVITINDIIKRVSIKKGINNSVHVEGISSFIHFLIDSGVCREAIIEYLKFHYADGTLNGTGINRKSAYEYIAEHSKQIDFINKQFNNSYILKRAINRFILQGKNSNIFIDVIIYGTWNDFLWIKANDVYNIIMQQINYHSTSVHFGQLFCQPMTRCLNYNPLYARKRFCVQIKWYSIFDDIMKNMNDKITKNKV